MKKWTRMILLGAVFTVLLCTSALAAEKGMYDVNGTGVTLTAQTATKGTPGSATVNIDGVGSKTISVDAERIEMTVPSAAADTEYLVFVLKGDTTTPVVDNIVYIDQKSGTTAGTFDLYPSSLSSGTYSVCMSTTTNPVAKVGSFGYYAAYKLGDVVGLNGSAVGDGNITMSDARAALQIALKVNFNSWTETQKLAADVDGNPGVGVPDARAIMQAALKMDTIFDWRS